MWRIHRLNCDFSDYVMRDTSYFHRRLQAILGDFWRKVTFFQIMHVFRLKLCL